MEKFPDEPGLHDLKYSDRSSERQQKAMAAQQRRAERMRRIQERAHQSMAGVRMVHRMAQWAVTMAVASERNRVARQVKRSEARDELSTAGRFQGFLDKLR